MPYSSTEDTVNTEKLPTVAMVRPAPRNVFGDKYALDGITFHRTGGLLMSIEAYGVTYWVDCSGKLKERLNDVSSVNIMLIKILTKPSFVGVK